MTFEPKIPIAAITDEFSPDLCQAIPVMKEIGITAAELRVVGGKNIMDLNRDELKLAKEQLDAAGLFVVSIASPLLKCVLPGGGDVDRLFEQDVFASRHTFEDQARLTEHAFELAHFFGAGIVRVFSYWRTVEPESNFEAIVSELAALAELAAKENLLVGLENEHACHIGTAGEARRVLDAVPNPHLVVVWDPANALVAGENPFPDGYGLLPPRRIGHVHAKDCEMIGHQPVWGPLGTRHVDWKGQVAALRADGYQGYLSLETHWPGPDGNKLEGSRICGWNLRGLAAG
jgi:L-ribulose-5-phosphate 3-epimerase